MIALFFVAAASILGMVAIEVEMPRWLEVAAVVALALTYLLAAAMVIERAGGSQRE